MNRRRVVIADDHPRALVALRALLTTAPDIEVVGTAASGAEALRLIAAHRPEVVVVEVELPDVRGLAVIQTVRARWPTVRVVAVSLFAGHRRPALAAGAHAFFAKDDPPAQLLDAVLSDTVDAP
ncbi:MAG: response regulator transcription factor [Sphaerobacter sp.]|nr:response regulator transcription factor [Sphaerobacter sp.]